MKVRFLCDCEIEVCESYDEENDTGEYSNGVFLTGDETEFDIIDNPLKLDNKEMVFVDDPELVNVQFPSGGIACCVSRGWFEVIEE